MNFEDQYARHFRMVWNLCCTYLKHPADAEDAVQEVFLRLKGRALKQGAGTESLPQFLSECSGAGIRPPRAMNSSAEYVLTGMMGA